jgi:hypothetical protein
LVGGAKKIAAQASRVRAALPDMLRNSVKTHPVPALPTPPPVDSAPPRNPPPPAPPEEISIAAPVPEPTPAFKTAQTVKAEKVIQTNVVPAAKECPNCTASVPRQASRCRCGFEFPSGECLIPPLTMTAEDRAAIVEALKPSGRRQTPR